ncbi:MAG: zinc-dependent alcohol dehydrogenase family protein [Planctomycetes bacterium]|nr:zinc-dependent alcohol dehydrogenase family protein [Planctomycetota bacterium]
MKAMLLNESAPIETAPLALTDLPDPQPRIGQIRLSVLCCAICRTDLHVIEGELPPQKMPIIPGHQVVGIVDEVGPGCKKRFAVGQRVGVAWLRHTCGCCPFCLAERENLCESSLYTGYHEDGGYATQTIVPENFAYTIPDAFTDTDAAPLLCAGIIGYAALRRSQLQNGDKLGIYGFGSSAHVVIQIALHRSCDVYVVTRSRSHRQLARQMGAKWVGENAADMPVKVDAAIVFAPAGDLVPPALAALQKGGTLALAGIYMTPIPQLDYEKHLFYERNIHSVTANTRADGLALLAEAAQIPIRPHVTCYDLHDANYALQDLKADKINGTGVLMMSD